MRQTVITEAGNISVDAEAGRVVSNGVKLLPVEARALGHAMLMAADGADAAAHAAWARIAVQNKREAEGV
jgi:hypothetical protein